MKVQSLLEQVKVKAGIVPYLINEDDQIEMYFMIPSDPAYGGSQPQIAKGRLDGQDPIDAAFREGEEELGLKRSNVITAPYLACSQTLSGLDATYTFNVYACQVESKQDFDQPHYETGQTFWLTLDQFKSKGRRSQLEVVNQVVTQIQEQHRNSQPTAELD